MENLGGAGDRFGDSLCVDCANLLYDYETQSIYHQQFARPITKYWNLGMDYDEILSINVPRVLRDE